MKRVVAFLLTIVVVALFSTATAGLWGTPKPSDNELRRRIICLSDSLDEAVLDPKQRTKFPNYEDAITCLYCYIEEGEGSYHDASDAWIYLSNLLDSLENEMNWLCEEYYRVHPEE